MDYEIDLEALLNEMLISGVARENSFVADSLRIFAKFGVSVATAMVIIKELEELMIKYGYLNDEEE